MAIDEIVLLGVGDVGPVHEPMEAYGALARPTLAAGDIRFAQCERIYSDRGAQQVHGSAHTRIKPHLASIFSDCGFDVVSVASNHAMDFGEDALMDSIDHLRQRGIQTVGAGRNLQQARTPAIIERHGIKVAFLAYCSVLQEGYAAGPHKGGIAPLRAYTYYRPTEYQTGLPPKVVTIPYEEDMDGMIEDIESAKKLADSVIVSLHWGVHFIPRVIADYQPTVAKAALRAGADLILGHHAHAPKAINVINGKTCFYSLSNFIMSVPPLTPERAAAFGKKYGVVMDPDYPKLWYGADAKRSMIAKAVISKQGVRKVSFLPVLIDKQLRPEVLRNGDPRFKEAVDFMEWVSEESSHKFSVDGDEVVVTGA